MSQSLVTLTSEQEQEINSFFDNEKLFDFMTSTITGSGEEEPDDVILQRAFEAIDVVSKQEEEYWRFGKNE